MLSPLELVVVLAAAVLVLARWSPPAARRPVALGAAVVAVTAGLGYLVIGVRWQLVPVLVAMLAGLAFAVTIEVRRRAGRPVSRGRWWRALPASVAGLGLIAVGPVAAWAFPVPDFPEPSGPYAVGTSVLEWTDADRPEPATAAPDDRRAVVVQLWYPARTPAAGARRARYFGRTAGEARTVSAALAAYLGLPGFLLDGPARAFSHAVPDAPVAASGGRFPVVVFSPGLGSVRTQNTAWAEELASRGYVIAGVDHPYDSAAVVFADGRTVRTKVAASGDDAEDARRAIGWTTVRAGDLSFVLTQLGRLDSGEIAGPLTGRLDTGRAAATGHSIGGAAALRAARQDPRFTAAINLDGYPYDPDPGPIGRPVLAFTHATTEGDDDYFARIDDVLDRNTTAGYRLTVPGSAHVTFTDAPLYLPPVPGLVGPWDRTKGPRVTAWACAAFLDATLRGESGDLRARLSSYGEVRVYS